MTEYGGTAGKVLSELRAHGFRPEGDGWRGVAFWRGGAGKNVHVTLEGDEHGAYKDFADAGDSGSLYQLAEKLGIELPTDRRAVASTKRPYSGLADYAAAHGITADVLRAAKWSEGERYCAEAKAKRPALIFPTATGERWRYIDGKQPPYGHRGHSPDGSYVPYKKCWYGLKKAVTLAQTAGAPLILCNGEISTVAAQHHGLAACCVTSGEDRIPDDLLTELNAAWSGDIAIAFDCDTKGQQAASKVKGQLPTARVIDLGLTDGGDLADLCLLYGADVGARFAELWGKASTVANTEGTPFAPPVPSTNGNGNGTHAVATPDELQQLTRLAATLNGVARNSDPATKDKILSQVQTAIEKVASVHKSLPLTEIGDVAESAMLTALERMKNPRRVIGWSVGLWDIDNAIRGLQRKKVLCLYGAASMGKSTVAAGMASVLMRQAPGIVLTTETDMEAWAIKVAAYMTRIPDDVILDGSMKPEQLKRFEQAMVLISGGESIYINDSARPTVDGITNALKRARDEGRRFDWLLIDSASRVGVDGMDTSEKTAEQVKVAEAMITWAKEWNIGVIATVQIGRAAKNRQNKEPLREDAQHTSAYEQNAHYIFGIYRHEYYTATGESEPDDSKYPPGTVLIKTLKNREGRDDGRFIYLWKGGAGVYNLPQKEAEALR